MIPRPALAQVKHIWAAGDVVPGIFDIPAQPLAAALDAFSSQTGREIFYDGSVGRGRWSTPVKGVFKPEDALSLLLAGTGFFAQPSGSGAYTLDFIPEEARRSVAAARIAVDQRYVRYFAIVQHGIRDALCRNTQTRPGAYRVLIKFWIAPSGALDRVILRGTTGDPKRDIRFVANLKAVTLAESPPVDMPQPITLAIFPIHGTSVPGCQDVGNARQ